MGNDLQQLEFRGKSTAADVLGQVGRSLGKSPPANCGWAGGGRNSFAVVGYGQLPVCGVGVAAAAALAGGNDFRGDRAVY